MKSKTKSPVRKTGQSKSKRGQTTSSPLLGIESLRAELKHLGRQTSSRFGYFDTRFGQLDKRLSQIQEQLHTIVFQLDKALVEKQSIIERLIYQPSSTPGKKIYG